MYMIYQCSSCGASMVYNFTKMVLECPNCGTEGNPDIRRDYGKSNCPNCGAELTRGSLDIAWKCGYCGTYYVDTDEAEGEKAPAHMIPTTLTKKEAFALLQEEYKNYLCLIPEIFSDKRLDEVMTEYVPYWVYNFDLVASYDGTAKETSRVANDTVIKTVRIQSSQRLTFGNIPADASDRMPDEIMDAVEPFAFDKALNFDPQYLAGSRAQIYAHPSDYYAKRAYEKMETYAREYFAEQVVREFSRTPLSAPDVAADAHLETTGMSSEFWLLPVYVYKYTTIGGRELTYYINGQTKEIYGTVPISRWRLLAGCLSASAFFMGLAAIVTLIVLFMGGAV